MKGQIVGRVAVAVGVLALVGLSAANAAAQAQVWSDEFNGTQLDSSIWTFDVGGAGSGNAELQYYTSRPENVKVTGGDLVLTALREKYMGNTNAFTSGRVKTQGRLNVLYGSVEARVKIPDLREGLWPAVWLLGANYGQLGWPGCGEIDIMEMGNVDSRNAGVTNQRVSSTDHFNAGTNYAFFSQSTVAAAPLNTAYHLYRMDWTPSLMTMSLDGTPYFSFDLTNPAASSREEFHLPYFILFNLAVGGNYTALTTPAAITAPFPAEMHIDYVRVFGNGSTQLNIPSSPQVAGNFGIFTDTQAVSSRVAIGTDGRVDLWNNMALTTTTPQEGANAWSWNIAAANWWGMGVFASAHDFNLKGHSDGKLHFSAKTTTTDTIGVGIASAGAGEGWVDLANGGNQYGLVRDGAWHEVVMPLNGFANVDFGTIKQLFMLRGGSPAAAINLSVDNVWWEASGNRPTPANGDFAVYSDNAPRVATFNRPTDGDVFVWAGTLAPTTSAAFEGANVLSYTSVAGQTWFGLAFSPAVSKYNLTAYRYANSRLHFAMKTTSSAIFYIGMKSGTVNEIGQRWIRFAPGADPYGFARDGAWHAVDIPMTDISAYVDLSEVAQLFELLGVDGPTTDIALDDIRFTGGGAPLGTGPTPTATSAPTGTPRATATATATTRPAATPTATTAPRATPTSANLALGKAVTASSFQSGYPATNAVDGNTGTRWASNGGVDPQWIYVDLGASVSVARVVLNWEVAYGKAYQIQTSNDAAMWTSIYSTTASDGAVDDLTGLSGSGRYVRMYGTARGTAFGYSLWEMEVYGTAGAATPTATARPPATPTSTATATATATPRPTATSTATATTRATATATATTPRATATATSAGTNLALGKAVTASTTQSGYPGSNAVDGNTGTRWSSNGGSDPQWIYVDLGATTSIARVKLNWEAAYGKAYQIQTSNDAATWTSIFSTTTGDGAIDDLTGLSGSGRYVRVYGTARGTSFGYSLWEVEVYSTGTAPTPTATSAPSLLSQGRPATASSTQNTTFPVSNAVDGSTGTRWESQYSDPQWIYVDLGAAHTVSRVVLTWEAAYGKSYQIQTSPDAVTWTSIFSTTAGDGATDDLAVSGSGRYVRMYGTARGTAWGYSLWELQVYGQ